MPSARVGSLINLFARVKTSPNLAPKPTTRSNVERLHVSQRYAVVCVCCWGRTSRSLRTFVGARRSRSVGEIRGPRKRPQMRPLIQCSRVSCTQRRFAELPPNTHFAMASARPIPVYRAGARWSHDRSVLLHKTNLARHSLLRPTSRHTASSFRHGQPQRQELVEDPPPSSFSLRPRASHLACMPQVSAPTHLTSYTTLLRPPPHIKRRPALFRSLTPSVPPSYRPLL